MLKHRTICEVLREIDSKFPDSNLLVTEATGYAKSMDAKLKEYKAKYSIDYEPEVFVKPSKELKKEPLMKRIFGVIVTYWDLGTSKVIGRFQTGASLVMMVFTLLAVYGYKFGIIEFVGFILCLAVCGFSLGVIYNRAGLYKNEINKAMEIHPYYSDQLERLKRLESKLDELKELKN